MATRTDYTHLCSLAVRREDAVRYKERDEDEHGPVHEAVRVTACS